MLRNPLITLYASDRLLRDWPENQTEINQPITLYLTDFLIKQCFEVDNICIIVASSFFRCSKIYSRLIPSLYQFFDVLALHKSGT